MRRRDQFMATGFRGFPRDMQEALVGHASGLGDKANDFLRGVAAMLETGEKGRIPALTTMHQILETLNSIPEDARKPFIDTILDLGGDPK
jgi:hypothetical protein